MTRAALTAGLGGVALSWLIAGCAHQVRSVPAPAPAPAPPEPFNIPQQTAPAMDPNDIAIPAAAMPNEWHDNGEDYDDLFDRMRDGFALEDPPESAIDQQLEWFVHNPEYLERVFQRAQRYLYHIVCEVEARGMPAEFALLPVVESAYEPFAYSPSRAAGLWQFIPGTGVRFGLKQSWWYDGRRDVVESTRAALDYLQQLHDQFNGDWLLAIAAYNVGEAYIQRAIDRNVEEGRPIDFWHLHLPAETRAYVPKLLAMKRLMDDPEKYGLSFTAIPNEPYFAIIETNSQIDLKIATQLAGTTYDEIVALNPGYNRWATDPEGPHRLLVPIDHADSLEAALKTLDPADRVRYITHRVAKHETLPAIAKQYGTSVSVIAKVNNVSAKHLSPGQVLNIPQDSAQLPDKVMLAALRVDRPSSALGSRRHQIVHRVRAGETLRTIARRHGIDVATLARLNGIGAQDRVVRGQTLVVRVSSRRYRGEGRNQNRRVMYTVHRGDTLSGISRQFQVSVSQIKTWNGLNKLHQIRPGQHLVMYVEPNRHHG